MKTYLVGGAVRDQLLGRTIHDRDYVVVGATEDEILGKGFLKVGKSFPVFLHPKTKEEYALARRERKVQGGYRGFEVEFSKDVTLEEDLKRRDLTINAIAFDGKNYIDPFHGIEDLNQRILRPVSEAFMEDPVRVLRLARFKCRFPDFTIHSSFYSMIEQMKEELRFLTPERIRFEVEQAFKEEKPSLFFETLNTFGVLDIVFPILLQVDEAIDRLKDKTLSYAILLRHLDNKKIKEFLDSFNIQAERRFVLAFAKYHEFSLDTPENILDLLQDFRIQKKSDLSSLLMCAHACEISSFNFLVEIMEALERISFEEVIQNTSQFDRKYIIREKKIETIKAVYKNLIHKS